MNRPYDLEFNLDRARKIERAIQNKKWTKTELSSKTGYDGKTIRNLLSGQVVRDQTVIDVCEALGIEPMLENTIENVACADDEFGGYLRNTHSFYEGYYHVYRRSFSEPGRIFQNVMHIRWDETDERLLFSDFYSPDPAEALGARVHSGTVYMSSYTGLVHLMTVYQGSVRLITATTMRQSDGIMRGSMMTQCEDVNFFQPAITPIVIRKIKGYDVASSLVSDIGIMQSDHSELDFAQRQLCIAETKVIKSCVSERTSGYSI